MPQKLIALIDYYLTVAMTIAPVLAWFVLNNIGGIISLLIFVIYWIPEIKKKRVDEYYGGSWIKWIKGAKNFFKNNK